MCLPYHQHLLVLIVICSLLSQAIREALDIVDADPSINLDEFNTDYNTGDFYIDSITIFHSGYGAEWGVSASVFFVL